MYKVQLYTRCKKCGLYLKKYNGKRFRNLTSYFYGDKMTDSNIVVYKWSLCK